MPGKHAPPSSSSFYTSLARAGAGALAAVGLVVAIVFIAVSSRGNGDLAGPDATGSPTTSPSPTATGSGAQPTPTASVSPSESVMPEPILRRRDLAIEVLNGNGIAGAAGEVRDRLLAAGYRTIEATNTELTDRTTIYFRGALRREARRLFNEFPEFRRVREARSGTPGSAQITIVLGRDHEPPG